MNIVAYGRKTSAEVLAIQSLCTALSYEVPFLVQKTANLQTSKQRNPMTLV